MLVTFRCKHCQQKKPINPKRKGDQVYCGAPACQRARKAAWQKQRLATDQEYCKAQHDAVRQWQKTKPAHQYQAQYRSDHPAYVAANRAKQRLRNGKRRRSALGETTITKEVLPLSAADIYMLTPVKADASGKIVKMDVLLVQLQRYQANPALAP